MKWLPSLATTLVASPWSPTKDEFQELIGRSNSAAEFAESARDAVQNADPWGSSDLMNSFLEDLYGACPRFTSDDDGHELFDDDVVELQETCRLLIWKATAVLDKTPVPQVGKLLTKTSANDYQNTEKMIQAARRVLKNAVNRARFDDLMDDEIEELATGCDSVVSMAEDILYWPSLEMAFEQYGAAMTAARLFERMIALEALHGAELSLKKDSQSRFSALQYVQRKRIKNFSNANRVKADLRAVIDVPDLFRTEITRKRQSGRAHRELPTNADPRPVKRYDVAAALQLHKDNSASFLSAVAPWLVPAGVGELELKAETEDVGRLKENIKQELSDYRQDESASQIMSAKKISRMINEFVARRYGRRPRHTNRSKSKSRSGSVRKRHRREADPSSP